ncbi:hypothetical protein ADCFC_19110 [Adlercreutzia hattorii]|uniref:Mobilization protein n=2 Tax=Eggerthellaceae TaxID=1643826 RepID=A0A6F8SNQ9_9ACTN|nr:hypothetical protein ADCFC_20330 [Adlercreutzia hattorii]
MPCNRIERTDMVCKNEDRARPITVAFRVTKEMSKRIDLMAAMSGLTKQDYIMSKLCDMEVTVVPSPRALKALRDEVREVCKQLNRLRKGDNPSEHLLETCDLLADVMLGLRGDETRSEIEDEDEILKNMGRC